MKSLGMQVLKIIQKNQSSIPDSRPKYH